MSGEKAEAETREPILIANVAITIDRQELIKCLVESVGRRSSICEDVAAAMRREGCEEKQADVPDVAKLIANFTQETEDDGTKVWTVTPRPFEPFNTQQLCDALLERYNRLSPTERAKVKFRVCTNGGFGFGVTQTLRAKGLPVIEFYRTSPFLAGSVSKDGSVSCSPEAKLSRMSIAEAILKLSPDKQAEARILFAEVYDTERKAETADAAETAWTIDTSIRTQSTWRTRADWQAPADALIARYYRTPKVKRPSEIEVICNGCGCAVADYLNECGVPVKETYLPRPLAT